jgi:hypothetical protein
MVKRLDKEAVKSLVEPSVQVGTGAVQPVVPPAAAVDGADGSKLE